MERQQALFVTPVTDEGTSIGPTQVTTDLTKISFAMPESKGALQNRTMYIVPYCGKSNDGSCGVVVTDSPGIITQYRKHYMVNSTAWKKLFQSDSCTATLLLVFPTCRVSYTLQQTQIKHNEGFVPSEKLPPDLKFKVRSGGHHESSDDDYRPLFALTSRRCKRMFSQFEIREHTGQPSFFATFVSGEFAAA